MVEGYDPVFSIRYRRSDRKACWRSICRISFQSSFSRRPFLFSNFPTNSRVFVEEKEKFVKICKKQKKPKIPHDVCEKDEM